MSGNSFDSFVQELRRRSVLRIAAMYGAGAFMVLQFADLAFPRLGLPDWTITAVLLISAAGFPIALIIAWMYERTEDGIQPTHALGAEEAAALPKGRMLDFAVIAVLCLVIGWLYLDRLGRQDVTTAQETSDLEQPVVQEVAPPPIISGPAIVVLPFENLSADADNAYFAAGMHEDILTQLSRLDGLKVISRTSSMRYANKGEKTTREIAEELQVNHVLEGSVRKAGSQVRITVQLIDAQSDAHLWSSNFDRQLDNIFAVQSEVAEEIAGILEIQLSPEQRELVQRAPTGNMAAYDLFLQARDIRQSRLTQDYKRAIPLLEAAIKADPEFADAYGALAEVYGIITERTGNYIAQRGEILALAQKGLSIDPLSSESHSAMGLIHFYDQNMEAAIISAATAHELKPNDAALNLYYARILQLAGRVEEAKDIYLTLIDRDPMNAIAFFRVAEYFADRDEERAYQYNQRAIELEPTWAEPYNNAAVFALRRKDYAAAYDHSLKSAELDPETVFRYFLLAWMPAAAGHSELAKHWQAQIDSVGSASDWAFVSRMAVYDAPFTRLEDFNEDYITGRQALIDAWGYDVLRSPSAPLAAVNQLMWKAYWLEREERFQEAEDYKQRARQHGQQALAAALREDGTYKYNPNNNFLIISHLTNRAQVEPIESLEPALRRFIKDATNSSRLLFSSLHVAAAHALLGEKELALDWMEKAADRGMYELWVLNRFPQLESLRNDVRYQRVLSEIEANNAKAHKQLIPYAETI